MSTESVTEILMLCEEFIPGDSGDPAEFFFDKVTATGWSGLELINISHPEPGKLCFCAGDVPLGEISHPGRWTRSGCSLI